MWSSFHTKAILMAAPWTVLISSLTFFMVVYAFEVGYHLESGATISISGGIVIVRTSGHVRIQDSYIQDRYIDWYL